MSDRPIRPDYETQTIRITDLTVIDDTIVGRIFSNCQIVGPAMLVPQGHTSFVDCGFDVAGGDTMSLVIVVPPRWLVGAIGVVDCEFHGCRFTRIGFIGDDHLAAMFRDMGAPSDG